MSGAGKDANARPESPGDSLPVRTIARVAPQSVQLAKDHALLGRSVWCALVWALVAVITVVNLLPPANVGYKVTNQVLVSGKRFEQLQHELKKSSTNASEAVLLDVKLLDDAKTRRLADPNETQLLLQVTSQWSERTSAQRVQKWLNAISTVNERSVAHSDMARMQRFARWEVQTRQQYLQQHRDALLAKKAAADADAGLADASKSKYPSNIKLASNPDKPKVKFATLGEVQSSVKENAATSFDTPNGVLELSGPEAIEEASPSDEFEKQLRAELAAAEQIEKHASSQVSTQAIQASGTLTLAAPGRVSAVPERMPRNQVLSIIILALAVGALGGWVNHRAQSGGTFSALDVSRNLQLLGLPVLGNVVLPTSELEGMEGEVTRRFTDVRRWLMQQCLALAELLLLFWCLAILIRMVLDPLWRGLVWENPLSGLARLFVGLP